MLNIKEEEKIGKGADSPCLPLDPTFKSRTKETVLLESLEELSGPMSLSARS